MFLSDHGEQIGLKGDVHLVDDPSYRRHNSSFDVRQGFPYRYGETYFGIGVHDYYAETNYGVKGRDTIQS